MFISAAFLAVEFVGGLWTNSLALLADAGHMLTDTAAMGLSLFAIWFSLKPATPEKTYGYFRVEILAALINGTALLLIALAILREAYARLLSPVQVKSLEMLLIATAGLAANLVCAYILQRGHRHNLNLRGAFLHVVGDILGSLAAISAGVAMLVWRAYWVDPVVSVLVSGLICWSALRLVRDSVRILLEGAPSHLSVTALEKALCGVPGVESVHDLHVWTLTSGLHAMTCHAVVESGYGAEILEKMNRISREKFEVWHTTIQIEEENMCRDGNGFCR